MARLDSVVVEDHFQEFLPTALWDEQFSWLAKRTASPHELFDFQTLLGHLAGRAGRVRLGVVVTEPIRRHPVLIAQAMATLAHLTRRAPILGIGCGEALNTVPYGLAMERPVARLEEALQIIRMCFAPERPLDFEGEFFQLHGARMDLLPPQGRTPQFWVGAHGPRMLELTGRYGDGWYPAAITTPQEYADKLAVVRKAAEQAGRDPDQITPSLERYIIVAPTTEQARVMARSRPGRFGALLLPEEGWQKFGLHHPLAADHPGFRALLLEGYDRATLDAALDQVPEEMLSITTYGTPEQIVDNLRGFAAVGMRHVSLLFVSAMCSRRAALYSFRAAHHIARALA